MTGVLVAAARDGVENQVTEYDLAPVSLLIILLAAVCGSWDWRRAGARMACRDLVLLGQLVVVSDLEQVLSKLVGFLDDGGVSVLSLLPQRVGACVAFLALICECDEGAASVAAVFLEPD